MKVFCNYHNEEGECTQEDWDDAYSGNNPSRMVRVVFDTFTQAVPLNTLSIMPEIDECAIPDEAWDELDRMNSSHTGYEDYEDMIYNRGEY